MAELLISTPDGQVLANRKLDPVRAYWIGRDSHCDVVIENAAVSRRHCVVFHANGRWFACDAGSTVGLETESGAVRCATLSADAWIKIGSVYVWLAGSPAAAADWIDARPEPTPAGKPQRLVRLANEDLDALQGGGGTGAETEMLVVADHHGAIHLCADLSGLAASRGSGVPRLTIGRSVSADLQICDPSVDPVHAVLARGSERWSLIDAGSSCGIMFESKRWYRKRLEDGITLPIGSFRLSMQRIVRTTAPSPQAIMPAPLRIDPDASKPAARRPSAFLDDDDDPIKL